jgi:hypothetical protein
MFSAISFLCQIICESGLFEGFHRPCRADRCENKSTHILYIQSFPNGFDCGGGGSDVARLGLGVGPILVGGAKVGSVYGEADDWIAVDCDDDTDVDAVGGDEAGEAAKAPADGIGFSTIVSICVSKIGKKQITNTSYLSL